MVMHRKTFEISGLPIEVINRLLGLTVESARVRVHAPLWGKVAAKHPESLGVVELYLTKALTDPDFIGQAPHHFHNIELIKRTPAGPLLVAVKVRDAKGCYCRPLVASAYLINASTLQNRLAKRTLHRVR